MAIVRLPSGLRNTENAIRLGEKARSYRAEQELTDKIHTVNGRLKGIRVRYEHYVNVEGAAPLGKPSAALYAEIGDIEVVYMKVCDLYPGTRGFPDAAEALTCRAVELERTLTEAEVNAICDRFALAKILTDG